jgi:hypothetical protein
MLALNAIGKQSGAGWMDGDEVPALRASAIAEVRVDVDRIDSVLRFFIPSLRSDEINSLVRGGGV